MREMHGAEDESEGSLHIVNDRNRRPQATQQIAYFHAPTCKDSKFSTNNQAIGTPRQAVCKKTNQQNRFFTFNFQRKAPFYCYSVKSGDIPGKP